MIHEYAVDPDVLRHWHVFRHIADGLGFSRGRIIARYPRDWPKLAYQIVDKLDDNTKKKVVVWLADRANRAMSLPRTGAHAYLLPTWFENAIAEHTRMPFHAIVADQPPSAIPPVLRYSDVDESNTLWAVETQKFISRNVADIVRGAGPLLAHATSIRFIDPYFKGDRDQVAILIGSLLKCVSSGKTAVISIELHVDGKQVQPSTENHILTAIGNQWPTGLPAIKIVRWKLDHLHNRFILTNLGGIMFGDSLRQHQSRPDQMTLMEDRVRTQWWNHHESTMHPTKVCKPGELV